MAPTDGSSGRGTHPDTAARGRELVAQRIDDAPRVLGAIPDRFPVLEKLGPAGPRCLVSTGIGTSEGHARHLAEAAARYLGQPARFASTGSLAEGPPSGSESDWLVVFSQGLSANARHALSHVDAWGGVVLVTGIGANESDASRFPAEKREWLDALEARGVVRLELGCGVEYGALLRVVGARAGYLVAWSLLRTLAEWRLEDVPALDVDRARLRAVQEGARSEADRVFPTESALAEFLDPDRPLLFVSEGGALELVDQLTLKLSEGLLRPQPRAVDVLQFAHGPLQSIASRAASIFYLCVGEKEDWVDRFAATLDPTLHDLRVVRAGLPWPLAAVEFEAIFDHIVLRGLVDSGRDIVAWPGKDREAALYDAGPPALGKVQVSGSADVHEILRPYEESVWPEIESMICGGRRTALLGLGSIEQHGPHLPLGTDHWIAGALLEGLVGRLDDAIALPAIALGCASEHLDFAGTLHVAPETLESILADLLRSLRHHGFERAFLFTAHGGNVDALGEMRERLCRVARPIDLHIETGLRVGAMQSAVVEEARLPPTAAGPHAGEYETSLVARLRPGTVRTKALKTGRVVEPGESQGLFYPSLRPNTESGVLGDPSAAKASRGERYLEAWIDLLEGGYRAAFADVKTAGEKNRQYTKGTQNA